jgi:hypothetical protein
MRDGLGSDKASGYQGWSAESVHSRGHTDGEWGTLSFQIRRDVAAWQVGSP